MRSTWGRLLRPELFEGAPPTQQRVRIYPGTREIRVSAPQAATPAGPGLTELQGSVVGGQSRITASSYCRVGIMGPSSPPQPMTPGSLASEAQGYETQAGYASATTANLSSRFPGSPPEFHARSPGELLCSPRTTRTPEAKWALKGPGFRGHRPALSSRADTLIDYGGLDTL